MSADWAPPEDLATQIARSLEIIDDINLELFRRENRNTTTINPIPFGKLIDEVGRLCALAEQTDIALSMPSRLEERKSSVDNILARINAFRFEFQRRRTRSEVMATLSFRLEPGDIAAIQDVIDQIRRFFQQSDLLTEDHRRHLLRRLEVLQGELHKTRTDVGRASGILDEIEAGLCASGQDAAPLATEVRRITKLFQMRRDEIPRNPAHQRQTDPTATGG